MANIKTTPGQWDEARKLHESGKRLREIEKLTSIPMPNISKRAKKEGWKKYAPSAAPLELPKVERKKDSIKHTPTDELRGQVKAMSAYGLVDEEICAILQIHVDVLREHYSHELASASPLQVLKVAQSLFKMATDPDRPNPQAAMFWLRCRGGWNDAGENKGKGKKEQRQDAAKKAASGKFATPPPPLRLVGAK